MRSWRAHAVIAQPRAVSQRSLKALLGLGVPVVGVSDVSQSAVMPTVGLDNEMIGRLAAQTLIDEGALHFAYVDRTGWPFSAARRRAFVDELREQGRRCRTLRLRNIERDDAESARTLTRWLKTLDRKTGIFACNDQVAMRVTQATRSIGIEIPRDLALLGVDNDQLICELSDPPLSSIAVTAEQIGWEAARLVAEGVPRPTLRLKPKRICIPPSGVIRRVSSDLSVSRDPIVARAVRLIRSELPAPINVEDLSHSLDISRRGLERRFREALGRTPYQVITETRIDRAKALLVQTRLPIAQIATRCGYTTPTRLSYAFRRETGLTPRDFRRNHTVS